MDKGPIGMIGWALCSIGALNWGLVGALNWNLVDAVLGAGSMLARIVYVLVGISGVMSVVGLVQHMKR